MILLTAGQAKSASTYLAQILRRAATLASGPQDALLARFFGENRSLAGQFWSGPLGALAHVSASVPPDIHIGIKTHAPPVPKLEAQIRAGTVRVFVTYRDPGDAALSCFEAGAAARAEGDLRQPVFAQLETHRDAIDFMAQQVERSVLPWLRTGLAVPVPFERLRGDPDWLLALAAEAVGRPVGELAGDSRIAALIAGEVRVYNFNKGLAGRAEAAFSAEDRAHLDQKLGRFAAFCAGRLALEDLCVP